MDIEEATGILEQLANGINPTRGNKLPSVSPYNSPDVIRALFTCINHIKHPPKKERTPKRTDEEKQADNMANGRPRNAGLPWTDELVAELKRQFNSGTQPDEIALSFERSVGSIIAKLQSEGMITQVEASKHKSRSVY